MNDGNSPFRFGVTAAPTRSAKEWREKVRRIEDLGFDVLLVNDHLTGTRFAPLVALAAAAEATTHLRLSILVLANDYRHPAILAKESATLDVLSDGRLELGIGAGWMRSDYERAGIAFDSPGVRLDRLEESLAVLRGAWGADPFTFRGRHYRVEDLDLSPRPVQVPHPPILLGGGGPRMLRIAARHADIINITNQTAADGRGVVGSDVGLRPLLAKLAAIREAAGERWSTLELSVGVRALAVDQPVDTVYPALRDHVEQLANTPFVLSGSVDSICDDLRRWRSEHALSYFVLGDDSRLDAMSGILGRLR